MCNCTVEEAATALANCGFRAMYDNKLLLSLLASGGTRHMDTVERIWKHLGTLITFVVFATILTWIKTSGEWVVRAQEPRAQALRYVVICVILIVGYVAADQWVYETYPDTHQCMSVCSSVVWESISATPSMTAGLVYRHMERKHPNTTLAGMQAVDKAYGAFCDMHQVAQRGYNKVAGFQTAVFKRIEHMYMTTRHCSTSVAAWFNDSHFPHTKTELHGMCYIVYEAPGLYDVYPNKSIAQRISGYIAAKPHWRPPAEISRDHTLYTKGVHKAGSGPEKALIALENKNTPSYPPMCDPRLFENTTTCIGLSITTPPPAKPPKNVSEAMPLSVWYMAWITFIQRLTAHPHVIAAFVFLPLSTHPIGAQSIPTTPAFDPAVAIGGGGALTALVIFGLWVMG